MACAVSSGATIGMAASGGPPAVVGSLTGTLLSRQGAAVERGSATMFFSKFPEESMTTETKKFSKES